MSVQISLGATVLRPWGIVSPSCGSSLWEVFTGLRNGVLESDSSFTFPEEVVNQPVRCCVGASLSGIFQECPMNLLIQEVSECFGKYSDGVL